jgi:hypothetical protein
MKTRHLKWFLINGLFAVLLYFGFIENIDGAKRLAIFMVWLLLVFTFFIFKDEIQKKLQTRGRPVPAWMDVTYDIGVICFLIWFGAWWTGIAYTLHAILCAVGWEMAMKKEKTKP